MNLFLSVRFAEEFSSKEKAALDLGTLAEIAKTAGYTGLCMRASQVGIQSSAADRERAAALLQASGLKVSMVTGDFDVVYNNERGPNCLRNIQPYLALARQLNAPMIRVAMKSAADIPWAQRAADQAADQGCALVHQCHNQSLFETVDEIERTLAAIGRVNFGLIYEPANLELCGQDYGVPTIRRLAPWIFNVYLQNQVLKPNGAVTIPTWCRGPVALDLVPIHSGTGIDFTEICAGLRAIQYAGAVTVHQARSPDEPPLAGARATAEYLQRIRA